MNLSSSSVCPSFSHFCRNLSWHRAIAIQTKTTASPPKMMKATIAATLTAANQNSLSAKILIEKKLERKIKIMKTRLQIETGTEGNQCRMIIPAAVNSRPREIVQVSQ